MKYQDLEINKSDVEKFDFALEYIARNKKGEIIYDNDTIKKHLVIIHRLQASMVNKQVHEDLLDLVDKFDWTVADGDVLEKLFYHSITLLDKIDYKHSDKFDKNTTSAISYLIGLKRIKDEENKMIEVTNKRFKK